MPQEAIDAAVVDVHNIDFHHPYTPYDVQQQFMKTAYDVLERGNGQIGILESPTGTVSSHAGTRIHALTRFRANLYRSYVRL